MSIKSLKLLNALICASLLISTTAGHVSSQTHSYPDKIRGYKVERTVVEVKKTNGESDSDSNQLISFGSPSLARVTPLGITFEVPLVVAPVKQKGRIEFLTFEDIVINGHAVDIQEYRHPFELPEGSSVSLRDPLRIYIYLPTAMVAALGEWMDSKASWPVTGRVYVFGKFKKSFLSFKRCVPVELNLTMRNPLRSS